MTVPSMLVLFFMLVSGCEVCSAQWFRWTDAGGGNRYTPAPRFYQLYANLNREWPTTSTSTVVTTTTTKQMLGTRRDEDQPEGRVFEMFEQEEDDDDVVQNGNPPGKKDIKDTSSGKVKGALKLKKYYKYMLPLLLAYKLKFFTLVPLLVSALVLIAGSTGLAGFFFALFAAVMGIKGGGHH